MKINSSNWPSSSGVGRSQDLVSVGKTSVLSTAGLYSIPNVLFVSLVVAVVVVVTTLVVVVVNLVFITVVFLSTVLVSTFNFVDVVVVDAVVVGEHDDLLHWHSPLLLQTWREGRRFYSWLLLRDSRSTITKLSKYDLSYSNDCNIMYNYIIFFIFVN